MDYKVLPKLIASLTLVCLLIQNADGNYLRSLLCKKYSFGGEIDKREILTRSYCQMYCKERDECTHTLFLTSFRCCVYYSSQNDFEGACQQIQNIRSLANSAGCPASDNRGPPGFLPGRRITFPTSSTTSTTPSTTSPAATTTVNATTVSATDDVTTEATPEEETEAPGPDESEDCEEREWTGYARDYIDILGKLEDEESEYYCFNVCLEPRRSPFSWVPQPPDAEKKRCTSLKTAGPYLCAMFLLQKFRNPRPGMIVTVTLCKSPPPSTGGSTAAETMTTGATTEGVTDATDSTATGTEGVTEGADVTDATTAADVTGADVTGVDVTEAGADGEATGATAAPAADDATADGVTDVTVADGTEGTTAST